MEHKPGSSLLGQYIRGQYRPFGKFLCQCELAESCSSVGYKLAISREVLIERRRAGDIPIMSHD